MLIWGTRPDDALAAPVLAQLEAWRHRFPEQLLVPVSSARTDAHLIVADDHTALVGSGNLLASAGFEAAALLLRPSDTSLPSSASSPPSPTPAARPHAVLELLAWARSRCPDWLLGQAILTPAEFAPRPQEVTPAIEPPQLPALPEGRDTGVIPVWRASWSEYHAMLTQSARALAEGLPVVEVLQDGEIHEVIGDRTKQATWRLAVADDTTRSRPFRGPLLDDIEEHSRRSVVRVDCPDPRDGLDDNSPLSRLPRSGRTGTARGRVFLADHQVILGSATPLTTPTGQVAARRSQVGVSVHNRQLADEMADWLGLPAPEGPSQPAAAEQPPHRARDALSLARGALVAVRESTPIDEYLDRELRDHPEPWSLLDHLLESLKDSALPAAAVATVLRRTDLPDEQRTLWSAWLVGHLWERSEFVAAAVIGGSRPDDARAVSPDACLLAAAIEHAPLPVDLLPPTLGLADRPGGWEATAAARLAGVSGLLAQYLLAADATAKECALVLLNSLPAAWQELTSTAVGIYGETGAWLPLAEAARAVSQDTEHLSERARWLQVEERTEKLLSLHNRFEDFVSGSVMYQRLTANDGLLSKLHCAATTDDQELRREVVAGLPIKIRPYLDDIVEQSGKERIAWSDHRSFLEKVDEAVRMARAAAKARRSTDSPSVRQADVEFVGWLHECWEGLETAAARLPAPYQHPPLALLNRLRPLLVWRETQS